MTSTHNAYRPDIDGLRAVAIVMVVAFHAGVAAPTGGFVGVDVFFVISGYLITGILTRTLSETGKLSWGDFYARRARRLLPALAVVTLASLVVGTFVLVPDPGLRWLGQSAIAVALFVSNLFFYWKTSDYFGATAELQPLLNTWSLAVEEQFYLLWPVVLVVAWKISERRAWAPKRTAAALISALSIASLAAAELLVGTNQPAVFFLMPFRLWELGCGALLALAAHRIGNVRTSFAAPAALLGLTFIALSAVLLDTTSRFPGAAAIPTVVGTMLLIIAGQNAPRNPVTTALGSPLLVGVGKLSYSWYLVHWPLLVFVRISTGRVDVARDCAVAFGSLLLAWFSYRFVEQPARLGRWPSLRLVRPTLMGAVALMVLVILAGGAVSRYSSRISQLAMTPSEAQALSETRTAADSCTMQPTGSSEAIDCVFGEERPGQSIVLAGDSHALALLPALERIATSTDRPLQVMWDTACPLVLAEVGLDAACVRENQRRRDHLERHAPDIGGVVMTSRSSSVVRNDDLGITQGAPERWEAAVRQTAEEISRLGIPVLFVLDVPRFETSVPECLVRQGDDECDVARDVASAFRGPSAEAERRAVEGIPGLRLWDPMATLCSENRCYAQRNGNVLYRDADHLSMAGAEFIEPELRAQVDRLLAGDGS